MTFVVRPPVDYGVDRPGVEAPRGVELTGTNRPITTTYTVPPIMCGTNNETSKAERLLRSGIRDHYTNKNQPAR